MNIRTDALLLPIKPVHMVSSDLTGEMKLKAGAEKMMMNGE